MLKCFVIAELELQTCLVREKAAHDSAAGAVSELSTSQQRIQVLLAEKDSLNEERVSKQSEIMRLVGECMHLPAWWCLG
jgi:hypothetical protein